MSSYIEIDVGQINSLAFYAKEQLKLFYENSYQKEVDEVLPAINWWRKWTFRRQFSREEFVEKNTSLYGSYGSRVSRSPIFDQRWKHWLDLSALRIDGKVSMTVEDYQEMVLWSQKNYSLDHAL